MIAIHYPTLHVEDIDTYDAMVPGVESDMVGTGWSRELSSSRHHDTIPQS